LIYGYNFRTPGAKKRGEAAMAGDFLISGHGFRSSIAGRRGEKEEWLRAAED
jgi:hypothetical protein